MTWVNRRAVLLGEEGLVRLIGAIVSLLAASRIQLSVNAGVGWPYDALRYSNRLR